MPWRLAPALSNPDFGGIFQYIQQFQGYIWPGVVAAFLFGMMVPTAFLPMSSSAEYPKNSSPYWFMNVMFRSLSERRMTLPEIGKLVFERYFRGSDEIPGRHDHEVLVLERRAQILRGLQVPQALIELGARQRGAVPHEVVARQAGAMSDEVARRNASGHDVVVHPKVGQVVSDGLVPVKFSLAG